MASPSLRFAAIVAFGLLTAAPSPTPEPAPGWKPETGAPRSKIMREALDQFDGGLTRQLRREKYDKLDDSEFAFYRGTAHLFHRDLAAQKLLEASPFNRPETVTWIQGDLHILNFGSFDDDEGTVIYDLNDFDEAWVGSYLRDIWRAAVSIVLVSSSEEDADAAVDAFTEGYLDTLEGYRGNDREKKAQMTVAEARSPLKEFLAEVAKKNREKMLKKWTSSEGQEITLKIGEDLERATERERTAATKAISDYKDRISSKLGGKADYFKVLDVARRINAGTGSLGSPRFYVLIEGAGPGRDDDRILDVKLQSLPSVHSNLTCAESERTILSQYPDQGCRVAAAQKALLTRVDDHLGCVSMLEGSWSVRERSPFKDDLEKPLKGIKRKELASLAQQWGKILATDHARASLDADLFLFPGSFKEAVHRLTQDRRREFSAEVRRFAMAYAAQVRTDSELFRDLRQSQTIP